MLARMLFFGLVFVFYFLMNYLFLGRVFHYFGLPSAALISVIMVATFPLGMWVQSTFNNALTFLLHRLVMVWFGVVVIGATVTVLVELFRLLSRLPAIAGMHYGIVIIGVTTLLSLLAILAGSTWVTDSFTVQDEKITEPVRIVHLTDQHIHGVFGKVKFEKVMRKAIALQPDVIVITGDLFDNPGMVPQDTLAILETTDIPVLFVMGNHDFYVGDQTVSDMVAASSMEFLRSRAVVHKGITFIGIDDAEDKEHVGRQLPKISYDKDHFTVLLHHRPWGYEAASNSGVDLMLTGHTHGGQIFPGFLLVKLKHRYVMGRHHIGDMLLYVHTGSGTWGPPMRLGTWNKLTVINLVPKR